MISWHCVNCMVGWYPYMAKGGCPACGHGVIARQEPASPNAMAEYTKARQAAADKADAEALTARWDEYVAAWDAEVLAGEAMEFLRSVSAD